MKNKSELWLIRHGQTDWNLEGRYQGQADIPLNQVGLQQAAELCASLKRKKFSALYSSDLKRARMTAECLSSQFGLPIHIDPRLKEINQGEWEGQLVSDIKKRYQNIGSGSNQKATIIRPPGGETVGEVAARMAEAANEITRLFAGKRVLVVSHGLAVATLVCQSKGISLDEVYHQIPDNAQAVKVDWKI